MPDNDNRAEAIVNGQRQAENLKQQDLKNRQVAEAGAGLPQSVKDSLDASAQKLTKNNAQNDTSEQEKAVKDAFQRMNQAKKEQPKMGQGDLFQMGMAYLNNAIDKTMKIATLKNQAKQGQKSINKMEDTNTVNKVRDDVHQNRGSFTEKLLAKVKQELGPKADHVQVRDRFNKMIKNLTIKGDDGKPKNDKQKEAYYLTESELRPVPVLDKNGEKVTNKDGEVQMEPGTDLAANETTAERDKAIMAADIAVQNPAQSDTASSDNAAKPADPADNSKQQQQQQQQQTPGMDPGQAPTPTPSNN